MRTITIGDLHGLNVWNTINPEEYDKIIFLGDYCDSFTLSNIEILDNLKNIIEFKKNNMDKVVLLWGNHELHYLVRGSFDCSGLRGEAYYDFNDLLIKNFNLFSAAYQLGNYVWTHAGIHTGWWEFRFKGDLSKNIADQLNESFNTSLKHDNYLFDVGYRRGGYETTGGPFWADKKELYNKIIEGYNQIVGHNPIDKITTFNRKDSSITHCDCLQTKTEFYKLDIC